ncbi:CatA-like O-acetyltransferase [Flavobacterium litorale]|uniref:Chloramphenicol acetyltransferase n=1 Tax=Flavobacterium litorale TaxID=2856519 RepID=A0ABX8V932_9FLAO|nr:CatA-like O-acetyltransferase [Flavobacterium litorale]QYJ69222.1 chloramphenicol acetyltransferase [Flavobacterium litorale]
MYTKLNIDEWARREHFEFFKKFEEPFFGTVANIDVTHAYANAKEYNFSFYLYYLHKIITTVNEIEAFRYRISNDEVLIYDSIDASPTVMRDDNTFGFSLFTFHPNFKIFQEKAKEEIIRVQNTPGLFTRSFNTDNIIHFSALPWVNFTSLSHARSFTFPDSCPKISVGKITESNRYKTMPVSVNAHHALMDGYHVGQFFELLQQNLNEV